MADERRGGGVGRRRRRSGKGGSGAGVDRHLLRKGGDGIDQGRTGAAPASGWASSVGEGRGLRRHQVGRRRLGKGGGGADGGHPMRPMADARPMKSRLARRRRRGKEYRTVFS
uniref:H0303G06.21 protein n=1 Tax=Oryza sativa TaxID=4530 RepID=Q25A40_ORYSA|nr:H0323C08.8 [Oryza sativa]CAJ86432.1 H0303G06.21 [Oryza sativa]